MTIKVLDSQTFGIDSLKNLIESLTLKHFNKHIYYCIVEKLVWKESLNILIPNFEIEELDFGSLSPKYFS